MISNFDQQIENIIKKDNRYHRDAYEFVMQGLYYTQKKLKRKGHLTGKELSNGIKDFAREQFGPMAKTVLGHWGMVNTGDIGEIVFNLIDGKLLGKTDADTKEDFKDIYDFNEVFDKEYKKIISKQLKGGNF